MWLLVERRDAAICGFPGFGEDLTVGVQDPLAYARWHLGSRYAAAVTGCRAARCATTAPPLERHRGLAAARVSRGTETAWARSFLGALKPHRVGAYLNVLDRDDSDRVPAAFRPGAYRKLAELRQQYDTSGVFTRTEEAA